MVLRVEGELVGVAAEWDGYGASDDGAGYFAVEIVGGTGWSLSHDRKAAARPQQSKT